MGVFENRAASHRTAPNRRSILRGVGASFVFMTSGCLSQFGGVSKGASDVIVYNKTPDPHEVRVAVKAADSDHTYFDETVTVSAGKLVTPDPQTGIPWHGDYDVTVDVVDGPGETYRWSDVRDTLYVTIEGGMLSFEPRKRPPESA